jgi:hypothetical protein
MSDAEKSISASQLGRHIGMTYKTAWYVAHRLCEAMWEAKGIHWEVPTLPLNRRHLHRRSARHGGSNVTKASKTMVIGMAELSRGVQANAFVDWSLAVTEP